MNSRLIYRFNKTSSRILAEYSRSQKLILKQTCRGAQTTLRKENRAGHLPHLHWAGDTTYGRKTEVWGKPGPTSKFMERMKEKYATGLGQVSYKSVGQNRESQIDWS